MHACNHSSHVTLGRKKKGGRCSPEPRINRTPFFFPLPTSASPSPTPPSPAPKEVWGKGGGRSVNNCGGPGLPPSEGRGEALGPKIQQQLGLQKRKRKKKKRKKRNLPHPHTHPCRLQEPQGFGCISGSCKGGGGKRSKLEPPHLHCTVPTPPSSSLACGERPWGARRALGARGAGRKVRGARAAREPPARAHAHTPVSFPYRWNRDAPLPGRGRFSRTRGDGKWASNEAAASERLPAAATTGGRRLKRRRLGRGASPVSDPPGVPPAMVAAAERRGERRASGRDGDAEPP